MRRTKPWVFSLAAAVLLAGCKTSAQADSPGPIAAGPALPASSPSGTEILTDVGPLLAAKQYPQAIAMLQRLAQHGDVKAETMLASLYLGGPTEIRNPEQGMAALRSAVATNDPGAETMLGLAYMQGIGVTRDAATAISWYLKAAAQNDAGAQSELGAVYSSDRFVKKDIAQSVKWTAAAAEQGFGAALFNVGAGFAEGSVLPRDPRQAFFWYTVSLPRLGENQALQSKAVHGRDKAATEMTLDETRGLQIMAQTWVPTKGSLDGVRAQAGKTTIGPFPRDTGSGIALNGIGQVLTARHVVKDCKRVTVTAPGGTAIDAVVGVTDETADLAVLKPASAVGRPASFRADDTVRQGEIVLAAGYPISMLLGSELNTTEGTVSSIGGWRGNKNGVMFSAAVSPGNSGGPLLAADGAVIGVVEGQLDNLVLAASAGIIAENVNFASNIQVVRQFLEKNGIAYEKAPAGHDLSAVELSTRARNFTLLVACEE